MKAARQVPARGGDALEIGRLEQFLDPFEELVLLVGFDFREDIGSGVKVRIVGRVDLCLIKFKPEFP